MAAKRKDVVMVVTGLVLLVAGVVLAVTIKEPEGIMRYLPFLCIGYGCGIFGGGMGSLSGRRILENNPEAKKQKEIAEKDERNLVIGYRAKAKAYDMMVFVFGALIISFVLMETGIVPVVMLVCAQLFVLGYGLYCRIKYENEM